MSVEIDPQELGFQRPFTTEVSQILKIRNANHTPIVFKVKTTAPKQYCVRPNSGRVEPGKEVEVTVLLQAMKQEPPLEAKCRDKFLVQSVAVTSDKEFTNINEIWEHVGQADKSSVQEKKIRVVYLPQAGSTVATTPLRNGTNGITNGATPETAPPAYSSQRSPSPEQAAYTPNASAAVRPEDKPSNASSLGDAKASASNPAMPSNPPPAVLLSYDELKEKLAEAQKTIATYAQEGGLRLRKAAKGETSNETVNQVAHRIQATQGVPLQVVAALCLVSFLLAYLFF